MTQALTGFANTFSVTTSSMEERASLRSMRQGGNEFLTVIPLALQSFFAGQLMCSVYAVASGPLAALASVAGLTLSLAAPPLAILAYVVKEKLYERSLAVQTTRTDKYYEIISDGAGEEEMPTATIIIDGVERHFLLGNQIARRNLVNQNYVELQIGNESRCYQLEEEVSNPTLVWNHHRLREIPRITRDCIILTAPSQTLHYHTGVELDEPTATSRSFIIDGEERHFATAQYVQEEVVGLSGGLNHVADEIFEISPLPERLSRITKKALTWIHEEGSNALSLSMLVASVALFYFGQMGMALGALAAVTYEYLNHDLGLIPEQISLFMEQWMPSVAMVGLLMTGTTLMQITAAVGLLCTIPSVKLLIHHPLAYVISQVANVFYGLMGYPALRGPKLHEFDAPLVPPKDMRMDEINEILFRPAHFEFNPAALTKPVNEVVQLEENKNFETLLVLWDQINWTSPEASLRIWKRLADDDRFVGFLKTRFPEAQRFYTEGRETARNWIDLLAKEQGLNIEQFMAQWVKEQLGHFVARLSLNEPVEAGHQDLHEAIQKTSQIIPFLLKPNVSAVDKEDAILKLAIEGGHYCTRSMRGVSEEVLQGFIEPQIEAAETQLAKSERFERAMFRVFEKCRQRALQAGYWDTTAAMTNKFSQDVLGDVSTYDYLTERMKRGFLPMSETEMRNFSMKDLVFMETMGAELRRDLLEQVRPQLIEEVGRLAHIQRYRVLDYLRNWVEGNLSLNEEQRTQLLDGPLADTQDNLYSYELNRRWTNLFLTVIGIYRLK